MTMIMWDDVVVVVVRMIPSFSVSFDLDVDGGRVRLRNLLLLLLLLRHHHHR